MTPLDKVKVSATIDQELVRWVDEQVKATSIMGQKNKMAGRCVLLRPLLSLHPEHRQVVGFRFPSVSNGNLNLPLSS